MVPIPLDHSRPSKVGIAACFVRQEGRVKDAR